MAWLIAVALIGTALWAVGLGIGFLLVAYGPDLIMR